MLESPLTPQRRFTEREVRLNAFGRSSALGWALTIEPYAVLLNKIDFSIREDERLNGLACIREVDNHRCVEVTTGCCGELARVIDAALALPQLVRLPVRRLGPNRQKELLLGACMDFIVWHEIQHHGLGHVGHFCGAGDPGFAERGQSNAAAAPSRQPMSIMDRRACELSADGEAATFLWHHQQPLRHDRLSRYHGLARREMLGVISLAQALVFASIAAGEPAMHLYDLGQDACGEQSCDVAARSACYPHPCLRVMHAHAQLRPTSKWKAIGDRRSASQSFEIAGALSKAGLFTFDLFRPLFYEEPYLLAAESTTIDHWKRISGIVEAKGLWPRRW